MRTLNHKNGAKSTFFRAAVAAAGGAVFIFALLLSGMAAPRTLSASANSGAPWEMGVTAEGVYSVHEDSVLEVKSELLTFNITALPDELDDGQEYDARVTAEYTFYNPTAEYVTTQMAFPFASNPYYERELTEAEITPVCIDGSPADYQIRHTYSQYTDFETDVRKILDGVIEDDFYSADLPVTVYTITLEYEVGRGMSDYAALRLDSLPATGDGTRLVGPFGGSGSSATVWNVMTSGDSVDVYVLGDDVPVDEWGWIASSYSDRAGEHVVIDADIIFKSSSTTLGELIFSGYDEEYGISRTDWYNAAVGNLSDDKIAGSSHDIILVPYLFTSWYVYETSVAPNSSFTNSVTALLYPTIHFNYKPYIYEYVYYLSPAKSWADFGELEIVINTPYYIQDSYTSDNVTLESVSGGYRTEISGLPEGELTFALCSVSQPERTGYGGSGFFAVLVVVLVAVAVIGIAIIVVASVLLYKLVRKRVG